MAGVNLAASTPPRVAMLLSWGIDALAIMAVGAVAFVLTHSAGWIWTAGTVALTALALALWHGTYGGAVGHAVMRLRSLDIVTGLPSFRPPSQQRLIVRGGADDPFALQARPLDLVSSANDATHTATLRSPLRIVLDDGTDYAVAHAALVGRDPTSAPDARYTLVAIPDITRTISKAHLLIEIADDGVQVTDIGSANGTWVEGEAAPLTPHQPTVVPWRSTLVLGERELRLEQQERHSS